MGSGYLELAGSTSGGAQRPTLTSGLDFDVRVKVKLDVVTGTQELVTHGSYQTDGFRFLLAGSTLYLQVWGAGAGNQVIALKSAATLANPLTEDVWVRGVVDSTAETCTLYTSANGTSWTQEAQTSSSGKTFATANRVVNMGFNGSTNAIDGRLYQCWYDIGGTVELDADFTSLSSAEVAAGEFTEDSANAATVSILGSGWEYVYGTLAAATLHGDQLFRWIQENYAGSFTSLELVGALNELNGTNGVEYAQARGTFLGVDPAG